MTNSAISHKFVIFHKIPPIFIILFSLSLLPSIVESKCCRGVTYEEAKPHCWDKMEFFNNRISYCGDCTGAHGGMFNRYCGTCNVFGCNCDLPCPDKYFNTEDVDNLIEEEALDDDNDYEDYY